MDTLPAGLALKTQEHVSAVAMATDNLTSFQGRLYFSWVDYVCSLSECDIVLFFFSRVQEQQPTQHNFSVHKHNRYRWQKRVLQVSSAAKQEPLKSNTDFN